MSTATTFHTLTLSNAHVLLEIFPRNAEKHAFLRITISTSASVHEATFSNSELLLQRLDLGRLHTPPEGVSFENGCLLIPHSVGVVRLSVLDQVDNAVFVNRVSKYLLFLEVDVERERSVVERLRTKKQLLVERVSERRDGMVALDRSVRQNLPVLLASKMEHMYS